MDEFPYRDISPWVEVPSDLQPSLQGEAKAEVAIIGGGYTGLSTALALAERGHDVAVLEKEFAGFGASGRNAGHLTPTLGGPLFDLRKVVGEARISSLLNFSDRAVEHVIGLIRERQIQCDFHGGGNLLVSVSPRQTKVLEKNAQETIKLGGRVTFLPPEEMRKRGIPEAFEAGMLELGGTLHPGKYVMGLRRAALDAGVRLYEGSGVSQVQQGSAITIETDSGGSLKASKVVLATNAFAPGIPVAGIGGRDVVPVRVTLFETEPLTPEQRARVGWPGREALYTAHSSMESYRLSEQGTIVGGCKNVRYKFGSGLAEGNHAKTFRANETAFRQRFPMLGDVKVAHFWGGWIAFMPDFVPMVGRTGDNDNVYYGLCFAGHGIAHGSFMGELLGDLVEGKDNPDFAVFDRKVRRWPMEPLRWLTFKSMLAGISLADWRMER